MVYKHYGKDPSVEASGEALGCVLLECVSNLAANELYMEEGAKDEAVRVVRKPWQC